MPVEVESSVAEQRERRMIVLVVRDLTGRRQTEETLRSLAYHDPLTGLPNRLLFHDRLSQAIERARRARQLLTVMLVDLDRFKLINDSLGLETGDQIIKGVADRLVQTLRKSDTVARLGGDEFMVLLLGTNGAEAAAKVAQKVLEALRPPLQVDGARADHQRQHRHRPVPARRRRRRHADQERRQRAVAAPRSRAATTTSSTPTT